MTGRLSELLRLNQISEEQFPQTVDWVAGPEKSGKRAYDNHLMCSRGLRF